MVLEKFIKILNTKKNRLSAVVYYSLSHTSSRPQGGNKDDKNKL
jgi:hypothetical protein